MPPFLPRKRLRSPTPEPGPSRTPAKKDDKAIPTLTPRKPTLFDDLDAGTGRRRTVEDGKALLQKMAAATDDESSLSSLSEEEFEDVPPAKRQKTTDSNEDEDEDMEFEDVETHMAIPGPSGPAPSGDLVLTLTKETRVEMTNPYGTKKGPSKIERQIRISTHQMHIQMLMYHNAVRNAWLCDQGLQEILVKHLPIQIAERIDKWRRDSGLQTLKVDKSRGKGKGKAKATKGKEANPRNQRDWGEPAQRLAEGEVNMSGGDPLMVMLARLISYWKQRFRITAPGLRKTGYMSLRRLDEESKSFKEDGHDPERHGERIRDLDEFKECATLMEGSRDVSAQLFTGLLRGIGLEARLVASLQPAGFAWSQNEEAAKRNPRSLKRSKAERTDDSSDETTSDDEQEKAPAKSKSKISESGKKRKATSRAFNELVARAGKTAQAETAQSAGAESDDESVIDVTPGRPKVKASLPYDRDLLFPHYWSEVLSPVTKTYTPVDAVVLRIVGSNEINLAKFETRGVKAEKARQVTAYIIGHSEDGTAKDVTTRYLKRQVWPGRTKGSRYPVEKVPIYDKNGKVKKYEQRDWFKTVMSGYVRGSKKCPRTEIDDHEDITALKPAKAEKKEVPEGKETLQYYKSSPDFVLERHLKREEAFVADAQHVKMFTVKGKGEESTEEKVFRRKDVVSCKSMETWHKEGRAPLVGEEPLKRVPYRAATTNRRRELAEAENASGAKVLQGLYSRAQTDWIIPPPIENGIIPKNAFGNIDLYVDSMLPEGSSHLPYRGMVKICRRLNIDYAEAVTGFEFGHRMAVPVITGVVIAQEYCDAVMDEWEKEEVERVRKEDEKRKKVAIHMWRKMLMGMRIIERVREEYGDLAEGEIDELSPWANHHADTDRRDTEAQKRIMDQRDEDMGGGFLPEGFDAEEPVQARPVTFYPAVHEHDEDEDEDGEGGGGFVIEDHDDAPLRTNGQAYTTSQVLLSNGRAVEDADSDVEMQGTPSEVETPAKASISAAKKRKQPAKVTEKITPKSSNMKAKSKSKSKSNGTAKAKYKVTTSYPNEDEDEDGESSSLSELDSSTASSPLDSPPQPPIKKPPPQKSQQQKQKGRSTTTTTTTPTAAAKKNSILAKSSPMPPPSTAKNKKQTTKSTTSTTSSTPTQRKTPLRSAARKSQTALRSHYFQHVSDEDDDGDDDGDEESSDEEDEDDDDD